MRAIFRKNKKKKSPPEETVAKSLPVLPSGASTSTTGTPKVTINRASSPTAHNEASEGVEQFLGIIKDISEATEMLSPLKSACALVIRGIQTVRTLQNNQTAWTELCGDLERNLALMRQHESELEEKPTIDDNTCKRALEHYIRVTVGVVELASRRSSTTDRGPLSTTTRIGTIITETEEIGRCREMIETAWQSYTLAMRRLIALKVKDIESQLKAQERDQDEAKRTQLDESRANFTSAYGDRLELCEEGTRLHILNAIQGWATDSETSKQIFWLCDAAGTGKSTIAATMAKEWSRDNSLAGRFFFSPNSITTQTTKEFCLTVARDIITNQTDLADIVQDAIDVTPVDRQAWLEVQLRLLIIDPLRHANGNRSLLLVIDALDNCVLEEERIGLLNGLIRYLPSIYHLKVLLTSRPMPDITNILATSPLVQSSEIQLLNVRQSYHHDINIYVEKRLGNISIVSSDQRKMIITMSGGLFLFAATVCRMLERDRHRTDILGILSNVGTTEKLERRMDILYLSALKQALVDKSANELMMSVLSLIIIAYQPLSINTLRKFLPNNAYVNDFVEDLGSVLKDGDPDRPIKVLHPTFREFVLSNEERANGFVVNSTMSSAAMAIACIDTLEHCLSEDIFHLDQAGRLSVLNIDVIDLERIINTHTTAAERYASAFWAHHVAVAELIPELRSRVVKFLSHKLLNWVELMSWRGSIETCVEGLSRLNGRFSKMALPSGSQIAESESSIIRHARQFVAQHQTLITESALQVYSVALFFTPQNPFFNQLKHRYSERLPRITTEYVSKWGNHVTIGGHSSRGYGESIYSLEFSPTGSRLISVGLDGLMFLWNGETGGLVGNPYQEPLGGGRPLPRIKNLRFSTDGTRFAFDILGNSKLHVYFSQNGHLVTPSVKQERPYCLSSTMSHIFLVVGSSLQRQTISRRGEPSLTEHIGDLPKDFETKRVLISPNSQYSLCIGDSKAAPDVVKLLLWELDPFKQVSNYQLPIDITKDLRYYLSTVNAIFSHDSSRCVVWTDTLLQILNCHTGEKLLETLDKEALHAYIVISPWIRLLACFTETVMMGSIAVRDLENGELISTLNLRGRIRVVYMSFSADGKRLASFSKDHVLREWSFLTGDLLWSTYIEAAFHPVSLSADWNQLAFVSGNQICLCDPHEEARDEAVERSKISILSLLGVSPVAALLAIRDEMQEFYLWNGVTGKSCGRIRTDYFRPRHVAFSFDGEMVAALGDNGRIAIWNIRSLEMTKHKLSSGIGLLGEFAESGRIFFSPDSKSLGVHHQGVAKIWDLRTEEELWSHSDVGRHQEDQFRLCNISPDNSKVAGFTRGRQINVWDLRSKPQRRLDSRRSFYQDSTGSFSPSDTSLLIIVKPDIELWRIGENLQLLSEIRIADEDPGNVSFSLDGRYLAYRHLCWDITIPTVPVAYSSDTPPPSFIKDGVKTHSFLTYRDGWIHSTFPLGPVLPIPTELRSVDLHITWHVFNDLVIFLSPRKIPIAIDCSPVLAKARNQ